jgi:hypothetical protein
VTSTVRQVTPASPGRLPSHSIRRRPGAAPCRPSPRPASSPRRCEAMVIGRQSARCPGSRWPGGRPPAGAVASTMSMGANTIRVGSVRGEPSRPWCLVGRHRSSRQRRRDHQRHRGPTRPRERSSAAFTGDPFPHGSPSPATRAVILGGAAR